jgi:hypothetical protein
MKDLKLINGSYAIRPVTIIVGNFGSGKSEVSVNLAMAMKAALPIEKVSIVDLDVVNPYFRCREAADVMEAQGISVVYPKGEFKWADLPIILPEIKGLLERNDVRLLLDVGGDDIGAKALASLADGLAKDSYDMLFVLNPRRPFTHDAKGATKIMGEIEETAGLKLTGLIVNTHLVDETTPDIVTEGLAVARDVSKKSGLSIRFATVMQGVLEKMDASSLGVPVLPLERRLLPPWRMTSRFSTIKV